MRFFLLCFIPLFAFALFWAGCSDKTKTASTVSTQPAPTPPPPKTDLPPAPPYKLTDKDELEIDQATNRLQLYAFTQKESEQYLSEYQGKIKDCDEKIAKQEDSCMARFAAYYTMQLGDRYKELGRLDDAVKTYLDAIMRTLHEHQVMADAFEELLKSPVPSDSSKEANQMTVSFNGARFRFQAYKDFAEIARYQKRIVEGRLKKGDLEQVKEDWKDIEESVKSSAGFKKEFEKDYEKLKSLKEKIPAQYQAYYNWIAGLAADMSIKPI